MNRTFPLISTVMSLLISLALISAAVAAQIETAPPLEPLELVGVFDEADLHRHDEPPAIRASFGGTVLTLPSSFKLFIDASVYDHSRVKVRIATASNVPVADCSSADFLEHHIEYTSVAFHECLGQQNAHKRASPGVGQHSSDDNGQLLANGEYQIQYSVSPLSSAGAGGLREEGAIAFELLARKPLPWPLENERTVWPPSKPNLAANIMPNYQSFGGASSAYWHEGVDILTPLNVAGDGLCRTPVDGTVVKIVKYGSSDLYWSLMVRDGLGFIWQYHHLDPRTYTVKVGDAVQAGTVLGTIIRWPARHNGNLYHHVHLNLVRPDPRWGTTVPNPYVDGWQYFSPLSAFDHGDYVNDKGPESDGWIYFFDHGASTTSGAFNPETSEPVRVAGAMDAVIRFETEFTATNSIPGHPYLNGLYEIGFRILDLESGQTVTPQIPLMEMSKIPNEWSSTLPERRVSDVNALLRHVYQQSFRHAGRTMTSVFTYQERRLYYRVTASFRGEPDRVRGSWNTTEVLPSGQPRFPNGFYAFIVYGVDIYGAEREYRAIVEVAN